MWVMLQSLCNWSETMSYRQKGPNYSLYIPFFKDRENHATFPDQLDKTWYRAVRMVGGKPILDKAADLTQQAGSQTQTRPFGIDCTT